MDILRGVTRALFPVGKVDFNVYLEIQVPYIDCQAAVVNSQENGEEKTRTSIKVK